MRTPSLAQLPPPNMSPAIPKDSIVLVTGLNGYIGSHVADQLLKAGYRVRGTTRDSSKVKNLVEQWEQQYGKNRVEVAIVQNMADDGAFDEAVKGVSGIAHVASNMSFSPNPNEVRFSFFDSTYLTNIWTSTGYSRMPCWSKRHS